MEGYKRGNLMQEGAMLVLGLVFVGVFTGAGVIALASFASGQTGSALNAINNATQGLVNFSIQLPTVGTIAAVGLIITVLVGALVGAYVFFSKR